MFHHSIKVPQLYTKAAKISQQVHDEGGSVKTLVYQNKHINLKALYALVHETLQHLSQIDYLIKKSELLIKEPRIKIWLARILITELLWGKKSLGGDSKPVATIRAYEQTLKAFLTELHDSKNTKVNVPRYVRVNTLKISLNEAVEGFREEGWILSKFLDKNDYDGYLNQISNLENDQFMVDIHIDNLLVFHSRQEFHKHDAYRNGCIILQDKASCLPSIILNPPKGSVVLDMCAAPGMKTTQLAALVQNEGTVYAVERDAKRVEILKEMVEISGANCVKIINKDVLTLTSKDLPGVEYILVDPSCSGSGIVNRFETESSTDSLKTRLKKLSGFQIKILKHALREFKTVKRVVYSTCSIYPEENEAVVQEIISQSTRYKLVPAQKLLNGPWVNFGSTDYGELGSYCIYSKPEDDMTNGFFVAVFERLEEGEENIFYNPEKGKLNPFYMKARGEEVENGLTNNIQDDPEENGVPTNENENLNKENSIQEDVEEPTGSSSVSTKKMKEADKENINKESAVHQNVEEFSESYSASAKKKKRKKESADKIDLIEVSAKEENIKKQDDENSPEACSASKKKKKSKKENAEEENIIQTNVEDSPETCGNSKKKKKKKVKDNKNASENLVQNSEICDDPLTTNLKKKKKKHEDSDEGQNDEIQEENNKIDSLKTKLKRKSNEENQNDLNLVEEQEGMDLETLNAEIASHEKLNVESKLKKKKGKKNTGNVVESKSLIFDSVQKKSKKKKESTSAEDENFINDEEMVPKKKNKSKHKTEELK